MAKSSKTSFGRRGFLKNAAAGAAALATTTPLVEAQTGNSAPRAGSTPAVPPPTDAQIEREAGNIRPPVAARIITRPGSDLMVQTVRDLGIEYAIANPGSSFEGLQESFINYGNPPNVMPEWITALHEESAVTMAHGYAKAEGKPALALLHGTIGIQHAAMSIYQAYYDKVPVLMIAGNDPDFIPAHTAHDMAGMVRSYTKWDAEPKTVDEALVAIQRAYNEAITPPMAPTLVVLSSEIQKENVPNTKIPVYKPPQFPTIDASTASEIAKNLLQAQNPRIAVGRLRTPEGVKRSVELAELVGACTSTAATAGPMSFPQRHPLCGPGADTKYDYTAGTRNRRRASFHHRPGARDNRQAQGHHRHRICRHPRSRPPEFRDTRKVRAADRGRCRGQPAAHHRRSEAPIDSGPEVANSGSRIQACACQSRSSCHRLGAGSGGQEGRMECEPYQHRPRVCGTVAADHE